MVGYGPSVGEKLASLYGAYRWSVQNIKVVDNLVSSQRENVTGQVTGRSELLDTTCGEGWSKWDADVWYGFSAFFNPRKPSHYAKSPFSAVHVFSVFFYGHLRQHHPFVLWPYEYFTIHLPQAHKWYVPFSLHPFRWYEPQGLGQPKNLQQPYGSMWFSVFNYFWCEHCSLRTKISPMTALLTSTFTVLFSYFSTTTNGFGSSALLMGVPMVWSLPSVIVS